jgi:hydrogenase maturation factor
VTCSDEGRLGEVISVEPPTAHVRTASGIEAVDVTLVADVSVRDLLLIHAGTAIAVVDDVAPDR